MAAAPSSHAASSSHKASRRRRVVSALALAACAAAVFSTGPVPAEAATPAAVRLAAPAPTGDPVAAARALDLVNAERAAAGLAALQPTPDTVRVATDWAFRMAGSGALTHNPELFRQLAGSSLVAENVGVGGDADQLHAAFLASPGHRANVLRENVTQLGVGAVRSGDGRLWVVQVFRLPAGVQAPPRGAPAPAPEPEPSARPAGGRVSAPAPALPRATRDVARD